MELTMNDLVSVATAAAGPFGWSSKYVDLLVTATGAVFRSEGLDESSSTLDVAVASVLEQTQRLAAVRAAQGASPRTISSYVAAWKRLAAVAREWVRAERPEAGEPFWTKVAEDLADTRVRRLVGRTRSTGAVPSRASADLEVNLRIRLADGSQARVQMPAHAGERDVLAVIAALTNHALRHGQDRSVSSNDVGENDVQG